MREMDDVDDSCHAYLSHSGHFPINPLLRCALWLRTIYRRGKQNINKEAFILLLDKNYFNRDHLIVQHY